MKSLTKNLNAAPAPLVRAINVPAKEVKLTVGEKTTQKRRCFQDNNINMVSYLKSTDFLACTFF